MKRYTYMAYLVALLAAVGCSAYDGPPLDQVTGTVTTGSQPLVGATLEFYPQIGGAPSYGKTNENGEFTLRYSTGEFGAVAGRHRVNVIGGHAQGQASAAKVDKRGVEVAADPDKAPKRGAKPRQGIEINVKSGEPTHVEIAL
ncbi:carboxypeptidase-like regulatory domain-containing protein [Bremerella sp. JC770]|uniref:carboxypeptidase-like regulatory domain-containing protein n=1 Tax=Bremerella sp. JC770 TaxID=3232137 RepID=UPI003457928E